MPFEYVSCQGRFEAFFLKRGHQILSLFQAQFFPAELIISNLSNKNDSRGVRGHAAQENVLKFAYCKGHFSAF